MQKTQVLLALAVLFAVVPRPLAAFLSKSKPGRSVVKLGSASEELLQISNTTSNTTLSSANESDMPEVHHNKSAGNGYHPGSPLYEKQQDRKEKGIQSDITPAETSANWFTILTDGRTYRDWWKKTGGFRGYYANCAYSCVSFFIVTFLAALVHLKVIGRHRPQVEKTVQPGADGFSYGLCSCDFNFNHALICFCACCCLPVRWADTVSKEPVPNYMGFWAALLLICVLSQLCAFTLYLSLPVFVGVLMYYRQKLRKEYGIVNCFDGAPGTLVQDCLVWFCCGCCAAVQEARQVEFCTTAKVLARSQAPSNPGMLYQSSALAQYQTTAPSQYQSGAASLASQRM